MPDSSKIQHQQNVLDEPDYFLFQTRAELWFNTHCDEESAQQWRLFCRHVDAWEERKPEKRMVMGLAFHCFANPVSTKDLAQLLTLSKQIKSLCGVRIYRQLLECHANSGETDIQMYLAIMPILTDLCDVPGIPQLVKDTLPDLAKLRDLLIDAQSRYLAEKYPPRDIDTVLQGFVSVEQSAFHPWPTFSSMMKLSSFKADYLAIEKYLASLKTLPQDELKTRFLEQGKILCENKHAHARQIMVAIMAETIRRIYKILPYDTQIISLLALLDTSAGMKGRIAQIKTGEGKSTLLAMMAALMGAQGHFVDLVTSSDYLAIRDCKKYTPFFEALGLTCGHVCYQEQQEFHFHPQILLGTNSNFQFPLLRDGLHFTKIRKSYPLHSSTIRHRTADVILVDEVDNMMLDALGAARIAAPSDEDVTWMFQAILDFVKNHLQNNAITEQTIIDLKQYIIQVTGRSAAATEDADCIKWVKSAQAACYKKQKDRDYVIRPVRKLPDGRLVDDIVIVDYENTGRASEGCQWQHGLHQMLQLQNGLLITPTSKTIASISHVSFYNEYEHVFGVTGTMGEVAERAEIQSVYRVDSFDAPPHFPGQRMMLPAQVFPDEAHQWEGILQHLSEDRANARPSQVLFRTIEASRRFSDFANSRGMPNQLLNETQRESEDYIVARVGESGMITIATNTGGRGLDAILSNESKEAGGLSLIFAFYPETMRCEEQGFGRAGRQGQPGRCRMILNRHDPFIQSLSNSGPDSSDFKLNFHRLQLHLLLEKLETEDCSAAIMPLLHALRSANIVQASAVRCHHASRESFYYSRLQAFFGKLESVYQQLDTEAGRDDLIHFCEQQTSKTPAHAIKPNENDKAWRSVYSTMQIFIEDQTHQKPKDLLRIAQQGIDAYKKFILNQWSQFYTKLTDQSEFIDMEELKSRADALYAESNLEAYLVRPVETVQACLQHLWKKATRTHIASSYKQPLSLFAPAPHVRGTQKHCAAFEHLPRLGAVSPESAESALNNTVFSEQSRVATSHAASSIDVDPVTGYPPLSEESESMKRR